MADSGSFTLRNEDCLDALPSLAAESVHLTFTSPPYFNARDYAQYTSYEAYLDFLADVFAHVLRLTKAGRYLVVNTSPVIVPRPVNGSSSESTRFAIPFDLHARLSAQGWQFAEDIVWRKPLGAVPRRRGVWLRFKRSPLTWKPDLVTEYLLAYRKPSRLTRDCLADYDADTRAASVMPRGLSRRTSGISAPPATSGTPPSSRPNSPSGWCRRTRCAATPCAIPLRASAQSALPRSHWVVILF